jgi:hypothetical protein
MGFEPTTPVFEREKEVHARPQWSALNKCFVTKLNDGDFLGLEEGKDDAAKDQSCKADSGYNEML